MVYARLVSDRRSRCVCLQVACLGACAVHIGCCLQDPACYNSALPPQTTPPQFCQSACTAYHVCKAAMRKVGQCPLKKEKPMLQAPALQGARRNGDELM